MSKHHLRRHQRFLRSLEVRGGDSKHQRVNDFMFLALKNPSKINKIPKKKIHGITCWLPILDTWLLEYCVNDMMNIYNFNMARNCVFCRGKTAKCSTLVAESPRLAALSSFFTNSSVLSRNGGSSNWSARWRIWRTVLLEYHRQSKNI